MATQQMETIALETQAGKYMLYLCILFTIDDDLVKNSCFIGWIRGMGKQGFKEAIFAIVEAKAMEHAGYLFSFLF